jgi:hypothetical protein
MSRVDGQLSTVLRRKPSVISRAVLWRIPHKSGAEDVRLKLGRYKWTDDLDEVAENLSPKSELTLDQEEFQGLLKFLGENYEPFRKGVKAFIPLDKPFDADNARQIKALFSLPNRKELVSFILKNEVIPEELEVGLRQAQRIKAVKAFEAMLGDNLKEQAWQMWFQANNWVLGSQFVRVLEERDIDTKNISDFLMEAYDGFLDVVEIKRPEGGLAFWASARDHGNYVPSTELTRAVAQANRYIYEVEQEANSVKFLDRTGGVRTVKPRCILVFGRSKGWNADQMEAYRIFNSSFHNLSVLTYDHVLARAKRIAGIEEDSGDSELISEPPWDDDIPF